MNDRLTSEEREAAELALLAGRLGDMSTWAEPRAGLEDAVVQAVVSAPAPADTAASASVDVGRRSKKPRRRPFTLSAVGVAAAVAIVLAQRA